MQCDGSPSLGVNLGGSFHRGTYDDAGDYNLTILAADARLTWGPFELLGEYATSHADIDRSAAPNAADSQRGAYAQANFHFGYDLFLSGSVFTAVTRWDWVDFDTDRQGDSEVGLTYGLNFLPMEDVVFKLDYNTTWKSPVDGGRGGGNGRFFFAVASYF